VAADDLDAPLGQNRPEKPGGRITTIALQAAAGVLGAAVLVFVLWTTFASDPFGGEPIAVVPAPPPTAIAEKTAPQGGKPDAESRREIAQAPEKPADTQTVTIIDGSSGKRQEVVIPAPGGAKAAASINTQLLENSPHGPIPRIGANGERPLDVYAARSKAVVSADAPRVVIIVGGLGIGASNTAEALSKLPAPVTFAFMPYGSDLENLVARARADGHEVLLQIPMEPVDYPDNDPGPQTLLASLSPAQNIDRLHWFLSRAQGYVGVMNFMGARFGTATASLGPILHETSKRGLLYVDDGSSARSVASQLADAAKQPFAKADLKIDSVPTAAEIDRALGRLEQMARERQIAIGTASVLPLTVERIAKWAKAAAARGIVLVPISSVAAKAKSS
jgi:polysaccharide deacetylase 2 family uncharacterized protein YibQ